MPFGISVVLLSQLLTCNKNCYTRKRQENMSDNQEKKIDNPSRCKDKLDIGHIFNFL